MRIPALHALQLVLMKPEALTAPVLWSIRTKVHRSAQDYCTLTHTCTLLPPRQAKCPRATAERWSAASATAAGGRPAEAAHIFYIFLISAALMDCRSSVQTTERRPETGSERESSKLPSGVKWQENLGQFALSLSLLLQANTSAGQCLNRYYRRSCLLHSANLSTPVPSSLSSSTV